MRVLVAGGAGLIGATMCARLLERGDEVVCVDNLVTGSRRNLDGLTGGPGITFVEADVCQPLDLAGPFGAVINLACPASPADFGPLSLEILDVSSRGTSRLLDLAAREGARYLQASTSEVYGDPQVHPQPETYWGNVNPIGPRSVYDEAKRFAEALVMAHHRRHGTEVRIARIFNTYGPGMRADDGRIVSNFVTQALRGQPLTVYGDGSQTRSFCYVDDEVEGLLALLGSEYVGPINIGSDNETPVIEFARLVIDVTGSASSITYRDLPVDDPAKRQPDLTLARRHLRWEPTTKLADGLLATVEWFRAHMDG